MDALAIPDARDALTRKRRKTRVLILRASLVFGRSSPMSTFCPVLKDLSRTTVRSTEAGLLRYERRVDRHPALLQQRQIRTHVPTKKAYENERALPSPRCYEVIE